MALTTMATLHLPFDQTSKRLSSDISLYFPFISQNNIGKMMDNLSVKISGPTLSFLLHDTMKSSLVQEGFLFGEILEKKTSTITDNDQRQVNISKEIHVTSSISIVDTYKFYNSLGRVNGEWIQEFLGKLGQKILGWYLYRPYNAATLTFRERLIHKHLSQLFNVPHDLFTCCLVTKEHSDNGATHTLCQTFVRHLNHVTESIPVHIINVSDPNNTYKTPSKVSDGFRNLISELKIDNNLSNGLGCVTQIQQAMQKKTDQMTSEIAKLEEQLFKLEKEVLQTQTKAVLKDFIDPDEEQEEKKETAEVPKSRRSRRNKN